MLMSSRDARSREMKLAVLALVILFTVSSGEPSIGSLIDEIQSRVARVLIGKKLPPTSGVATYRHLGSGLLLNIGGTAILLIAWHSIPSTIGADEGLFANFSPFVPGLHRASIFYMDPRQDVAVLRVPGLDKHASGLRELDVVAVDEVAAGEPLVLIGFPDERARLEATVTYGEAGGVWCAPPPPSRPEPAVSPACPPSYRRVLTVLGRTVVAGMSGGPALSRSSGKLVGLNHGFGQSSTSEIGFIADITGAIAVIRRALEP